MTSPAPIRGKGLGAAVVWPSASTACKRRVQQHSSCTLKPGRHQCPSQFWEDFSCPLVWSQRRLLPSHTRQQVCSLLLNASWLNPLRAGGRETNTCKQRWRGEVYFQAPFRDLSQKRVTKHLVLRESTGHFFLPGSWTVGGGRKGWPWWWTHLKHFVSMTN